MAQSPLHKLSATDGLDHPALLHTLIDSLPEHVYVKDAEGHYILKIDRQLINRGREDVEKCAAITSTLINMRHSLGLEAIVEGVETEEQLAKLKEMGCKVAQGYYFSEPLPNEAAKGLVMADAS